jgi:hypothetical protein
VQKVPNGTRGKSKLYLKAANTSPEDILFIQGGNTPPRRRFAAKASHIRLSLRQECLQKLPMYGKCGYT